MWGEELSGLLVEILGVDRDLRIPSEDDGNGEAARFSGAQLFIVGAADSGDAARDECMQPAGYERAGR